MGSPASPRWRYPVSLTPGFPTRSPADLAAVPGVAAAVPMIRTSVRTAFGTGPAHRCGREHRRAGRRSERCCRATAAGGALRTQRCTRRARRRPQERRDVPARLADRHGHRGPRRTAARRPQRRALRPRPTCLGAERRRAPRSARLDSDHHQTRRRPHQNPRRRHRRGQRPGRRRRPEHAGRSSRRRRQDDELHGADGRGRRVGGRRLLDLHHGDHGDHPAQTGHLDAARDRRPARHHRSRHAGRSGDSRRARRSHRVGVWEY